MSKNKTIIALSILQIFIIFCIFNENLLLLNVLTLISLLFIFYFRFTYIKWEINFANLFTVKKYISDQVEDWKYSILYFPTVYGMTFEGNKIIRGEIEMNFFLILNCIILSITLLVDISRRMKF